MTAFETKDETMSPDWVTRRPLTKIATEELKKLNEWMAQMHAETVAADEKDRQDHYATYGTGNKHCHDCGERCNKSSNTDSVGLPVCTTCWTCPSE
jgi:hypothetical protein